MLKVNSYTQIYAKDTTANFKIIIEKSNSVRVQHYFQLANYLVGSLFWNNYSTRLYLQLSEYED